MNGRPSMAGSTHGSHGRICSHWPRSSSIATSADSAPSRSPIGSAPASPRKIRARGRFQIQNAAIAPAPAPAMEATRGSPVTSAIPTKPGIAAVAHAPSMLSSMLTLLQKTRLHAAITTASDPGSPRAPAIAHPIAAAPRTCHRSFVQGLRCRRSSTSPVTASTRTAGSTAPTKDRSRALGVEGTRTHARSSAVRTPTPPCNATGSRCHRSSRGLAIQPLDSATRRTIATAGTPAMSAHAACTSMKPVTLTDDGSVVASMGSMLCRARPQGRAAVHSPHVRRGGIPRSARDDLRSPLDARAHGRALAPSRT